MINSISMENSIRQAAGIRQSEKPSVPPASDTDKIAENRDRFVPSEGDEHTGIYGMSEDEEGNPKISVDGDEKKESPEKNQKKSPEESEENSTVANTDKVDREIKRLREKEQNLRQKLRTANEQTASDIQRQLERVTAELAEKDNDGYRRKHTEFT